METRVVHCEKEDYDVYIGRPSMWGNPFKVGETSRSRAMAIKLYRDWVLYSDEAEPLRNNLHTLKGKTLGCWCKPKQCHGDVLVELINNSVLDFIL